VQTWLSVFAPLIGSVVAVALGVVVALWRLRKERGYDRRLVWCEDMMAALTKAGVAVTSAAAAKDATAAEECWTETLRAYERLILVAARRDLYAPQQGVEAIGKFLAALKRIIQAHLDIHCPNPVQQDVGECLKTLRDATDCLVGLAREHLKLEKLPPGVMDIETRFAGSFRGQDLHGHKSAIDRE